MPASQLVVQALGHRYGCPFIEPTAEVKWREKTGDDISEMPSSWQVATVAGQVFVTR